LASSNYAPRGTANDTLGIEQSATDINTVTTANNNFLKVSKNSIHMATFK